MHTSSERCEEDEDLYKLVTSWLTLVCTNLARDL